MAVSETMNYNVYSPLESLARRTSRNADDARSAPPRGPWEEPQLSSPLLHGRFMRDSFATTSSADNNSFLAGDPKSAYSDHDLRFCGDDASTYSAGTTSPSRDSWQSTDTSGQGPYNYDQTPPPSHLPDVVVSLPPDVSGPGHARSPIASHARYDFSKPVHALVQTPESEEQKRRVLERNQQRRAAGLPNSSVGGIGLPVVQSSKLREKSPLRFETTSGCDPSERLSSSSWADWRTPSPSFHASHPDPSGPSRPNSSASSYTNNYSDYELCNETPTRDRFPQGLARQSDSNAPRVATLRHPISQVPSSRTPTPATPTNPSMLAPCTPQEYLQLGIQHHEANRLKESAVCFERSANEQGGCGVGMLMWGLTLRHGWGCEKNEKHGFKWLSRAAESAVSDLEGATASGVIDMSAVKSELVLAIYEVGQCYFQGWGVPKDQKMAVSFYMVAAQLGDPDAQCDLGFCLANGKGCKKDRKEAAKWYRAAVAQGQSDVGLAWIYKEKFQ